MGTNVMKKTWVLIVALFAIAVLDAESMATDMIVKHRHFPANVIVEWLGWTFYECTLEPIKGGTARTETVLSREYLGGINQSRKLMKINNETYIVATYEESK